MGRLGLNTDAAVACGPALDDREHVDAYVRTVDEGLDELRPGFGEMGWPAWPHRAPFLMAETGREAPPLAWELFHRGIQVRDGGGWGLPTFLRISVGLTEDHWALFAALHDIQTA